jgi:hypothetical protein
MLYPLLATVLYVLINWFFAYLDSLDPEAAFVSFSIFLAVLFLLPFPVAIRWLVQAGHIIKSDRYPAPGVPVFRSTLILRGKQAKRRAHVIIILAVLLITLSLAGAFFLPCYVHFTAGKSASVQQ